MDKSSKMNNKTVSKSISKYYLKSDLADIYFVIVGQGVKVPAHKTILAMASKVFEAMFFGPLKEQEVVKIVDANTDAFKEFLQFFYLPVVTLTMKNIRTVAYLVDKYDMADSFNICAAFLESNITEKNLLWGYQLAISLNMLSLKQLCEKEIQIISSDAFKTEMFLQCDRAVIEQILKLDKLKCSEFDLFNACIEWAKLSCLKNGLDGENPENVKKQLGDCFYLFRFGTMTMEEIATMISDELNKGLFNSDELADILRSKTDGDFQLNVFKHKKRSMPTPKWNKDYVIKCLLGREGNAQNLSREYESTCFSTNTTVLLGQLDSSRILLPGGNCFYNQFIHINFTVNVIEHKSKTFDAGYATKLLYTDTAEYSSSGFIHFSFTEPIVIHPNKIYEVRVQITSNQDRTRCYKTIVDSKVELDDKITITLHRKPSEKGNSNRSSVYALSFNRF